MAGDISMFRTPAFIRKQLTVKILSVLTIGVAIIMGLAIGISVTNQKKHYRQSLVNFGHELRYLAYASIKHPMSVGDSVSVEQQLLDIKEALTDTEIVICDFNQQIVFHASWLK